MSMWRLFFWLKNDENWFLKKRWKGMLFSVIQHFIIMHFVNLTLLSYWLSARTVSKWARSLKQGLFFTIINIVFLTHIWKYILHKSIFLKQFFNRFSNLKDEMLTFSVLPLSTFKLRISQNEKNTYENKGEC